MDGNAERGLSPQVSGRKGSDPCVHLRARQTETHAAMEALYIVRERPW